MWWCVSVFHILLCIWADIFMQLMTQYFHKTYFCQELESWAMFMMIFLDERAIETDAKHRVDQNSGRRNHLLAGIRWVSRQMSLVADYKHGEFSGSEINAKIFGNIEMYFIFKHEFLHLQSKNTFSNFKNVFKLTCAISPWLCIAVC